ncbi:hypothetical protein BDZ45DRAFT_239653 [Acephala macrosclerotiorum]|nr:hypothetical protein BDZ45DRAFT_239653 [Acephala macrosclerotiorum]
MPQLRSAHMPTTATPLPVRKRPGNRASGNQSGGDLEGGSHIHSPDLSIADQAAGASPSGMDPNDNTHSPDLSIADQAAGASPSGVGPNDNTHAPDLSIADQEARTKDPEDVSQSQTNNSATGTSPAGFESTNDAQSINSMLVEPNCEASPQDAVEWDQNTARGRYEWLKAELARTKVKQAELSFEKEVLSREFGINSDVIIVWSNTHSMPCLLLCDFDVTDESR